MLDMAADNAIAYGRKRLTESAKAFDIEGIWSHESVDTDDEPSIKSQVGKAVIELSDMLDELNEKINEEEAEPVDGDAGTQEEVSRLYEKAAQASA